MVLYYYTMLYKTYKCGKRTGIYFFFKGGGVGGGAGRFYLYFNFGSVRSRPLER